MFRIAIAIVVTFIALGALIVLAGRTDWYGMSYRMASDAIDTIDAFTGDPDSAPADVQAFSDPATWNPDFMRGALASPDCPTDTLRNVQTRMAAVGPYELAEFERTVAYYSSPGDAPGEAVPTYNRVSELVRRSMAATDRVYAFRLSSPATEGSTRGFSGYLVVRRDCIVHVQVSSVDD